MNKQLEESLRRLGVENPSSALIDQMMKAGVNIEGLSFIKNALSKQDSWLLKFITVDPTMEDVKNQARKLAAMNVNDPCLIIGETGTGKELLANALHGTRTGKFVPINCAGIPEQLIETELFGHVRGAFTGAVKDKPGMLEEANNGTIFLDEIGELAEGVQAKLLRAIQSMHIKRVGDNEERKISCRFIGATNKQVNQAQLFRSDLYFRLSTFELRTTPLRERFGDVLPIVASLLGVTTGEVPEVWHKLIDSISNFQVVEGKTVLPGNVRQIQKLVRRYQVLGQIPQLHDWL